MPPEPGFCVPEVQIQEEKRSPAFKAFAAYVLAHQALDRDTFNTVNVQHFVGMYRKSKILLLLAARQADLRPNSRPSLKTPVGRQGRGS